MASETTRTALRRTAQELMPARPAPAASGYEVYPAHPLGPGRITVGHAALAERLLGQPVVVIDGYCGVLWENLRQQLDDVWREAGRSVAWRDVREALLPAARLEPLVLPYLGGGDPIFGTAFDRPLADLFEPGALAALEPDPAADISVLYGSGAALARWQGAVVYVDVPKNEIQFRSRAGVPTNLGVQEALDPKSAYKRNYFVDWPALNAHKAQLLPRIDVFVDEQRPDEPTSMAGGHLREALDSLSTSVFRVRPWFEPGAWGGQWIKDHIGQLPKDVPNYAWSFELIVPENGLLFDSDGLTLETSFDALMFRAGDAVLGESAARFGHEFPIRFDFLDTFDGGNLSVQVHPRPEYIRKEFGERFTQDETYYILDCKQGAEVYLGFQEDIEPALFRSELERSVENGTPVDIDRFVQRHPAHKHDLFLIPHGTIHSSGVDNLVLEISATPYIFTFKLYDWVRMDLDGRPRPLNIDRGFANLDFERKGERVAQEFISRQREIDSGPDWRVVHTPTHDDHFYDVRRLEFESRIELSTGQSCQVMSLVEGESVVVHSGGVARTFSYAETFVVPAAAGTFSLVADRGPVKVVTAFVKPGRGPA